MKTIGFIGTGHMGGTLAKLAARGARGARILIANRTIAKAEALSEEIRSSSGVDTEVTGNREVARESDYIVLGIVPQLMGGVLSGISDILAERYEKGERFVIVTMATGVPIATVRKLLGGDYPIIRIMPNTPSAIGEGLMLFARGEFATDSEVDELIDIFRFLGRARPIKEELMDVGSAVAACGPAFVYIFIEALADGGVLLGLSRAEAYEYAATMTAGAAKLMLHTGYSPSRLKDEVCSPGGTTIEGVRSLEEHGFRTAVIESVIATYNKNSVLRSGREQD